LESDSREFGKVDTFFLAPKSQADGNEGKQIIFGVVRDSDLLSEMKNLLSFPWLSGQ
jgi:hypothetical protein